MNALVDGKFAKGFVLSCFTAYHGSMPSTNTSTRPATDRQKSFARTLLDESRTHLSQAVEVGVDVEDASQRIARHQDVLVRLVAGQDISLDEASDVITLLKSVNSSLRSAVQALSLPPGLRDAERVIANKFAKACAHCGSNVPTGQGFAVLDRGGWRTVCADCAQMTDAQRRAEQEARQEAERAAREAENKAALALRELGKRLLELTGSDTRDHAVRVAVEGDVLAVDNSEAAYELSWARTPYAHRHVGGPGHVVSHPLGAESTVELVEHLLSLSDDELMQAQARYGRHFHACGRCGSPLSDDASKAAGLGPDCAAKAGW